MTEYIHFPQHQQLRDHLAQLKNLQPDMEFKQKFITQIRQQTHNTHRASTTFRFALITLLVSILFASSLVGISAFSQPGQLLYPVKQFINNATRIETQPSPTVILQPTNTPTISPTSTPSPISVPAETNITIPEISTIQSSTTPTPTVDVTLETSISITPPTELSIQHNLAPLITSPSVIPSPTPTPEDQPQLIIPPIKIPTININLNL